MHNSSIAKSTVYPQTSCAQAKNIVLAPDVANKVAGPRTLGLKFDRYQPSDQREDPFNNKTSEDRPAKINQQSASSMHLPRRIAIPRTKFVCVLRTKFSLWNVVRSTRTQPACCYQRQVELTAFSNWQRISVHKSERERERKRTSED